MEACGSAHYWGRELVKLGHEVRLISAQFVRPFVKMGEFGIALPKGWQVMLKQAAEVLSEPMRCPVSEMLREALRDQIQEIRTLGEQVKALERQIGAWQRRADECQRIGAIPGVGLLTATAAVATMGEASSFRSGREFAAFLGAGASSVGHGWASEVARHQ